MTRTTRILASTFSCALLFAGSAPAAETLWTLKEAKASAVYPELAVNLSDRNEGGWRVIEWKGLVGFEQEPIRSQAANTFAFYLKGIPAELRPGATFRVSYRFARTSAGRWNGRPYRHDLMKMGFPGFCGCRAINPDTGRAEGFRVDISEDQDEASGVVDFQCQDGFTDECSGYIDAGARPWSAVLANVKWVKTPNARATGRDTAGNRLDGGDDDEPVVVSRDDDEGVRPMDPRPGEPRHEGPPTRPRRPPVEDDPTTADSGSGSGPSGACSYVFDVGVQIGAAELAASEGEPADVVIERLEAAANASQRVFFFARGNLDSILKTLRRGVDPADVRSDIVTERRRFARLAADHCACDITGLR